MINPIKILFEEVKVDEVWQRDDSYSPFEEITADYVSILGVKDGYVKYQYFPDNMGLVKTDTLLGFKSYFTKKNIVR